jgi:hypothetical protein
MKALDFSMPRIFNFQWKPMIFTCKKGLFRFQMEANVSKIIIRILSRVGGGERGWAEYKGQNVT